MVTGSRLKLHTGLYSARAPPFLRSTCITQLADQIRALNAKLQATIGTVKAAAQPAAAAAAAAAAPPQAGRERITGMSAEVVDSNPYSRLMALQRMGIVKDYEKIRDKTVGGGAGGGGYLAACAGLCVRCACVRAWALWNFVRQASHHVVSCAPHHRNGPPGRRRGRRRRRQRGRGDAHALRGGAPAALRLRQGGGAGVGVYWQAVGGLTA
jgi:hypothetical protein